MSDLETERGLEGLPTVGEWMTMRYGPDWTVADSDVTIQCEKCRGYVQLDEALEELDPNSRLYLCSSLRGPDLVTCRNILASIRRGMDGSTTYRRDGDWMQLILRSTTGKLAERRYRY